MFASACPTLIDMIAVIVSSIHTYIYKYIVYVCTSHTIFINNMWGNECLAHAIRICTYLCLDKHINKGDKQSDTHNRKNTVYIMKGVCCF